ncbi:TonB-dependent receptor [Avibacterium endocarditidis]|uniref:TonB-dependent siderophore receptor n=1 Tax=Avibacterium endocarditidis TaxID=380674 RepID=A0ABX4ZQA6_9PAST|nr:TonB-dependent receptor [Avibacterium endocarditidis]POY41651.1 TonB-dependent siderophore receptor [Avibacterium endocarditidis]
MKLACPLNFPLKTTALLVISVCSSKVLYAEEISSSTEYMAVLPTIDVVTTQETANTKGYVGYEEAQATRNLLTIKEMPQTVDVINIQKNKNYGTNDLSSILEGNAGIDATYDMRGENIYLRGFQADASDIYRDGIRESGQVRRSTANIERVEILKGPSSILYGRSNGGGVINMVSKFANFTTSRNIGVTYGSWNSRSVNLDVNQKINENVAVRLTSELSAAEAYRYGVRNKGRMFSPSISLQSDDGRLQWIGQYTYDYQWRIPDRNPAKSVYDEMGIGYRNSFFRDGDYVDDKLQVWRSDLKYFINDLWMVNWQLAYRQADQDFDHYFAGTYSATDKTLKQSYAWQKTRNKTFTNNITFNGEFDTARFKHKVTIGLDYSQEERHPILAVLRNQEIDPFLNRHQWPARQHPNATVNNRHKAYSTGIFVQDLISLTDNVKVLLGGRYDFYRFNSTNIKQECRDTKGHSFSPNVGVVWEVTPEHTLYASFNRSFSPYGGRGYLGISTDQKDVFNASPEYNQQYEVGIKSDWFDKTLSTTLSAYQLERRNIRYRPNKDILDVWAVRGKDQSKGVELSLLGQLAPKWYIRSSVGWMVAKIKEDKQNPQNNNRTLNNTGNFTSNLFVRYVPTEKLYLETGVTHLGKRYYFNNNKQTILPSFTRVDAMVGYNLNPVNITLAVSNLLNKAYWRSDSMPGNPRSFNLRLTYTF